MNSFPMQYITNIRMTAADDTVTVAYDNLLSYNINRAVKKGNVKAEKYILLYLYDPEMEPLSEAFLTEYGARLNNRLKADIPLFTVYPESAFRAWQAKLSDSARNTLWKQFSRQEDAAPRYKLLRKLADDYKIKDMPALVVIDAKNRDGYLHCYTSVTFRGCINTKEFYTKFDAVINAIENDPYDFDAIRKICDGRIGYNASDLSEIYERSDPNSVKNFFDRLLDRAQETQVSCSQFTGISRGTLNNYFYGKTKIKLENAYLLAVYLHMTVEELDWVISNNYTTAKQSDVQDWKSKNTPRIRAIVHCLLNDMELDEANAYLTDHKLKPFDIPLEMYSEF